MRVLLVYPNCRTEIVGWGDRGAIAEPLALEYVGAVALNLEHDVRILDLRLHPTLLEVTLLTYQPDVIGVTGYSLHVIRNLEICRRVRQILPKARIVVGGHHATLMPEDFFVPEVDDIVLGDATTPFREILTELAEQNPFADIRGVWRRKNGSFSFGGPAPEFDIDAIPAPARQLVASDRANYFIDWMKPIALIRTTVGCPYRCSFCSLWRIMDGQYYRRDIDRVVEEIASLDDFNIFFVDDEPFVNPKRMEMMARAISCAGIDRNYFAYCRIDTFLRTLNVMRQWREIGLKRLFFGVETIFDRELAAYDKRQKRDDIVRALDAARELDIAIMSNFIISPRYVHEDFDELVRFIEAHGVEYPTFTILTPIPGTPACNHFDGILAMQSNGRPDWQYFDLQHPVTETTLSRDEFMQEYYRLYRTFGNCYAQAGHPFYQVLKSNDAAAPSICSRDGKYLHLKDSGSFAP